MGDSIGEKEVGRLEKSLIMLYYQNNKVLEDPSYATALGELAIIGSIPNVSCVREGDRYVLSFSPYGKKWGISTITRAVRRVRKTLGVEVERKGRRFALRKELIGHLKEIFEKNARAVEDDFVAFGELVRRGLVLGYMGDFDIATGRYHIVWCLREERSSLDRVAEAIRLARKEREIWLFKTQIDKIKERAERFRQEKLPDLLAEFKT